MLEPASIQAETKGDKRPKQKCWFELKAVDRSLSVKKILVSVKISSKVCKR